MNIKNESKSRNAFEGSVQMHSDKELNTKLYKTQVIQTMEEVIIKVQK